MEKQHTSGLERSLAVERQMAAEQQRALVVEATATHSHNAALEDELLTVEAEAERLYEVVRAMRSLGEQLRERVGIGGPALATLPELPPRPSTFIRTSPRSEGDAGDLVPEPCNLAVSVIQPGHRPVVRDSVPRDRPSCDPFSTSPRGGNGMLPPNTGPWPQSVASHLAPSDRIARIGQLGETIARQWDGWQQLGQTIDAVLGQRSRAAKPSIRPAYGPVTSWFGRRAGFWGVLAYHTGVDVSLPIGSVVVSTADGVVIYAGYRSDYGYTVEIQHDGALSTLYAHLSRPLVRPGQYVTQGQVVALSGNTGISTGPHLHYEVRLNGSPIDPTRYW
ncbi:MAG TPA: M23 family metallopeptidase [Chloroflexota bacterium]|nr:M23 family metallopeptidase [Chloroflexota bacterium]